MSPVDSSVLTHILTFPRFGPLACLDSELTSETVILDIGLGAFAASELDKVFSGYQPH
jgi:hypothetical protein